MKRELSYQFDLEIERVYLNTHNIKCDVQMWWKSGKGKISTKNSIKLAGTQKYFDVREKLSIIAKIIMENGVVREKKTQLLIVLFTGENTSKLGGRVYLNLADFISADNLTMPISKRFQKSLESCPDDSSKIIFNISSKYIEQNIGGGGSQSPHDISFQANNNFANSFSSNFGRSASDMTFRPGQKQQQSYRRLNSYQQNTSPANNMVMSRPQYSSKQKRPDKDWEKEKMDTPSWDRSQRQKQHEVSSNNPPLRIRQRQLDKPQANMPQSRPMQFSFNPLTHADRQKMGLDNTQIIKDLKQIVQERGQKIKFLQQQNNKLRIQLEQRSQKSSAKSLSLLNQLNTTTAQKQQLQRQRSQLISQIEQLKQQNKASQQKCKSIHFQYSQTNNEYLNKLEQRKKMIEDLNSKLEEADRKASKYQDQLFRKENQLITKEKQYEATQRSKEEINRAQTEKLMKISMTLSELQGNFEKIFAEKEEIKKKYEESLFKLEKSEQSTQKISQNVPRLEQQLQKQRDRYKILETKYKQNQIVIHEIQNQLKLFSSQKSQQLKQKDQQLAILRDKYNSACKALDTITARQQSLKNTISERNVKIKSLETILQEKQQLIMRAKQYVTVKQQEIERAKYDITAKEQQLAKRNEFIQQCREYVEKKQKEYNEAMSGLKNTSSTESNTLKNQLKVKEKMLEDYISQRHRTEKQIQDMDNVIQRLKLRIDQCQDIIDQLYRKNESQESTLKELVKKNLDMQIQINMKDYQIQSLRSVR